MVITENVVVELASVEITDFYRVEIRQIKKRTDYAPDQARQLARELMKAADEAETAKAEDLVAVNLKARFNGPAALFMDQPY